MTAEIKAGIDALEEAFGYGRLAIPYFVLGPLLALKSMLRRAVRAQRPQGAAAPARDFVYLDPADMDRGMTRVARGLMRASAVGRIAARRRGHYRRLLQAVADLPGATPLHAELPESVVPYMFPLLIDRPDEVFAPLKRLGVPIWRWDALANTGCPVADRYGQALFQLPCHQELRDRELEWMIRSLRGVLRDAHGALPRPEHERETLRDIEHGLVHPPR
jgi:hypothetical protein